MSARSANRLWLASIAVAGDLALTATLVFSVAAMFLIGVVLYPPLFWWGVAGIAFFVWLARPGARFEARELAEPPAQLQQEIDALRAKLRVPGRMRVYLDDSFNAGAMQTRGFFGLFGTRCGLVLGVPLLTALSREQVLGIIAHEFGHFSRKHGILGQWLYRARVGWLQYAKAVSDSDSVLDRAAAWYARQFVPYFSALTFAESRRCEYEADSDAVSAAGGAAFAQALTRTAVLGKYWQGELSAQVGAWQLELPQPPGDFLERFATAVRQIEDARLRSWLDERLREPSSAIDTHPSLSERLRAVDQPAALVAPADTAGEALLGAAWPKAVGEFNQSWLKEHAPGWLAQHLWRKHIAEPLLRADTVTVRSWAPERQLARALAVRRQDPRLGLRALRELHQTAAEPRVRFAYAAALLAEGDESGVELMESLAREQPAFRAEAFGRVVAHFERKGDHPRAERWSAWMVRARESLDQAIATFVARAEGGQAAPSTLAAPERAVIAEAARRDACVAGAWLLGGPARLRYAADREPIEIEAHLLALAIDPQEAGRLGQDEERIAERYRRLARMVLPPDEACVARSFFTTEGRPEVYKPNSEFSLYATDEARLPSAEGFTKCDWQ